MESIPAQIVKATDLKARRIARRMSAAENPQREDLSAIEMIEAIVEIVDAELIEYKEYGSMGKKPADRVKSLIKSFFYCSSYLLRFQMARPTIGSHTCVVYSCPLPLKPTIHLMLFN